MRLCALVLAALTVVLAACGGNEKGNARTDTAAAAATKTAVTPVGSTTAAPSTTASAASAVAPATGATLEVKMVGDDKGYRFEPATITVKQGDAVKFIMVSGGPHNVAFDNVTGPVHDQLAANMGPNQTGDLSSPMLMNPNEAYTVSFAKVPVGTYNFHCTPHLAMGMKGTITVQ